MPTLFAALILLAAPPRVAVTPLVAGEGVQAATATALTDALAAEVRKRAGDVITRREIASVLSYEQQRSMLGCPSEVCIAELGTAVGADLLVSGDLSKVGESLLLHITLLDVAKVKVVGQADKRVRGGTVDDLLDALPQMAAELFGGEAAKASSAAPAATTAAASKPVASPWVEEPLTVPDEEKGLLDLWTDGKGHYVAIGYLRAPFDTWSGARLFWGDGKKFVQVRTRGGGASGDEKKLSRSFWEPRVGYSGGILDLDPKGGSIDCRGKQSVALSPVPEREARKLIAAAAFLAPSFRRIPLALARDDDGGYYYVDAARAAQGDPADEPDRHLYLGRKGSLVRVELTDVAIDDGGELFIGHAGKLKAAKVEGAGRDGGRKAEWQTPAGSKPLAWLDPAGNGKTIYLELGVYGQRPVLGTPCDPQLAGSK